MKNSDEIPFLLSNEDRSRRQAERGMEVMRTRVQQRREERERIRIARISATRGGQIVYMIDQLMVKAIKHVGDERQIQMTAYDLGFEESVQGTNDAVGLLRSLEQAGCLHNAQRLTNAEVGFEKPDHGKLVEFRKKSLKEVGAPKEIDPKYIQEAIGRRLTKLQERRAVVDQVKEEMRVERASGETDRQDKPFYREENSKGYIRFGASGESKKIGNVGTKPCLFARYILEHLGTAKAVSFIFGEVYGSPELREDLSPLNKHQRIARIMERIQNSCIRELQKDGKLKHHVRKELKGELKFEWDKQNNPPTLRTLYKVY